MLWNQILQMLLGGTLAVAPASAKSNFKPSSIEELLSYDCAKSVATLLAAADQTGPVFSDLDLVFTSLRTQNGQALLVVNAGSGVFSLPLEHAGLNRIRFTLPARVSSQNGTYFLSYLHDDQSRSRVFDIAIGRPAPGKTEADYRLVKPQRHEDLIANLDYQVYETAESVLVALTEGRLRKDQVQNKGPADCEHITRKNSALGRNLKLQLEVVGRIVSGPKTRGLASVAPARILRDQK